MKKLLKLLLFFALFVVIIGALYLAWEQYQYRSIQKEVAGSKQYWSDALDIAREQDLTVDEFVLKFGSQGDIVNRAPNSVLLRETIPLSNMVCSSWSFDISFSWSGGDTARLALITESGTCL